jgi:hypothetical protein
MAMASARLARAHVSCKRVDKVRPCREYLGIPDGYLQAALIPVAYPKDRPRFRPAKRRPVSDVSYWDGWGCPTA